MDISLKDKIKNDSIAALKSGDRQKTDVLRFLLSLIQAEELKKTEPLSTTDILSILQKEMKRKEESLAMLEKADRQDLIQEQKNEIAILSLYLPKMLGETEINALIGNIVGEDPAMDFGKIMQKLMPEVKGKADGALVSSLVKRFLSRPAA